VGASVFATVTKLCALALVVTAFGQAIRFPSRIAAASGGDVPTLAYEGGFRPNIGADRGDFDCGWAYMSGRRVSSVNHIFISTGCQNDTFAFAPIEFTDPVSEGIDADYSTSSTVTDLPDGTLVTNWGLTAPAGSGYNFWGDDSLFGDVFQSDGTQTNYGTLGQDWLPYGMTYNDDGSGDCCFYITYGAIYGIYPDTGLAPNNAFAHNMIGVEMTAQGAVDAFGPIRQCSGAYGGAEQCGVSRAALHWRMPDGSMGHGGSQGATQQGSSNLKVNPGPSFFRTASWPSKSGTYGWGSDRTTAAYRTTDIVADTKYLAHYANDIDMDTGIAQDNVSPFTPQTITMFKRPTLPTGTTAPTYAGVACTEDGGGFNPYCWEGRCNASGDAANIEADPRDYSGVGTWTATDGMYGGAVVTIGSQQAFVVLAMLCTGHTWYRTFSATGCQRTAAEIAGGGGPQACPRHEDHEDAPTATGPVCTLREAALLVYDMDDLQATPDYDAEPVQIIYLARQWGVKHWFTGVGEAGAGQVVTGMWYEPTEQKIYWANYYGDMGATQFGENRHVMHVASVNLTPAPAPTPFPILPLAAGAAVWMTGSLFTRRNRPWGTV
jgi:hypothetical protein